MERRESELIQQIVDRLEGAELRYDFQPSIGGLRPDFLVYGPEGVTVVIEAKGWKSGGGNTARARNQAKKYANVVGAQYALVVLWEVRRNYWSWGVVGIDGVLPALRRLFRNAPVPETEPKRISALHDRTVFAAMPFDGAYDDTFIIAMSYAAERVQAAAVRVDQEEFSGDIVSEIKRRIEVSTAVIVDLSESKPSVLYEAGYAHALSKPTVHICSTSITDLPFDVRNWNTISYRRGQTGALREPLASRLASVL